MEAPLLFGACIAPVKLPKRFLFMAEQGFCPAFCFYGVVLGFGEIILFGGFYFWEEI